MSKAAGFLSRSFRDPRLAVFGVAVFNFGWVWSGSSEWEFHKYIFMAALLLASSVLILTRRVWSNFLAATLCGYLPVQFAYEFWMHAKSAEAPTFSLAPFANFIKDVVSGGGPVMFFFALTAMILACSAHSMRLLASRRNISNDA